MNKRGTLVRLLLVAGLSAGLITACSGADAPTEPTATLKSPQRQQVGAASAGVHANPGVISIPQEVSAPADSVQSQERGGWITIGGG